MRASADDGSEDRIYAAKRNGRNQVICETDPEVSSPVESEVA
jgi:hypothetical protein